MVTVLVSFHSNVVKHLTLLKCGGLEIPAFLISQQRAKWDKVWAGHLAVLVFTHCAWHTLTNGSLTTPKYSHTDLCHLLFPWVQHAMDDHVTLQTSKVNFFHWNMSASSSDFFVLKPPAFCHLRNNYFPRHCSYCFTNCLPFLNIVTSFRRKQCCCN